MRWQIGARAAVPAVSRPRSRHHEARVRGMANGRREDDHAGGASHVCGTAGPARIPELETKVATTYSLLPRAPVTVVIASRWRSVVPHANMGFPLSGSNRTMK